VTVTRTPLANGKARFDLDFPPDSPLYRDVLAAAKAAGMAPKAWLRFALESEVRYPLVGLIGEKHTATLAAMAKRLDRTPASLARILLTDGLKKLASGEWVIASPASESVKAVFTDARGAAAPKAALAPSHVAAADTAAAIIGCKPQAFINEIVDSVNRDLPSEIALYLDIHRQTPAALKATLRRFRAWLASEGMEPEQIDVLTGEIAPSAPKVSKPSRKGALAAA